MNLERNCYCSMLFHIIYNILFGEKSDTIIIYKKNSCPTKCEKCLSEIVKNPIILTSSQSKNDKDNKST